jgi:hypothetical protein
MSANNENRNELLTATVILTNPMRTSVMGVSFLTRRMNVIAEPMPVKDEVQVAEGDKKLPRKHPVFDDKEEKKSEDKKVEEKKLDDKKSEEKKPEEKKVDVKADDEKKSTAKPGEQPSGKPSGKSSVAPVGESK